MSARESSVPDQARVPAEGEPASAPSRSAESDPASASPRPAEGEIASASSRFAPVWLVVAVVVAAATLRFWNIGGIGISHWDAGTYTAGPLGIGPYGKREIVLFQTPPLVPTMFRELFGIFGPVDTVAMAAIAALGTLTVLVLYLAGRRWVGNGPALVAAAALAGMEYHTLFSRQALTDVPFALWVLLSAWAFTAAAERRRWSLYFLAGLAASAAILTKYHGFLALVLMGLWLVLARARAWRGWLLACLLGAVAAGWLAYEIDRKLGLASFRASRDEWLSLPGLYLVPQTARLVARSLWEWVSPFVLAPAAIGFVVMARRRASGDRLVLAWTALFVLALPFYRFYPRLLVPVLLPIALAAGVGLEWTARRIGSRAGASETAVLAMLLLAPGAWSARRSLAVEDNGYEMAAGLLKGGKDDPRPDLLVTQHSILFYLRECTHPFLTYDEPGAVAALQSGGFRYIVGDLRLLHAPEFARVLAEQAGELKIVAKVANPLPSSTIVNCAGFEGLDALRSSETPAEMRETLETIRVWRKRR